MGRLRVLVVEDDAVIGELLAETLVGMGHDVCGIESNESDAVAAANRCKPDLMIVDAHLSVGSGVSAIESIVRTSPVPHVFMSGDTVTVRALRRRAVVIQKPFREPDLQRAIQSALGAAVAQ